MRYLKIVGVLAAIGLVGFLVDLNHGRALGIGDGSMTIGVPVPAGKPVEVYYLAPSPSRNNSGNPITLVSAQPGTADPGLEFVEARIYQVDAFPNGDPPLSWTASNGSAWDPAARPSVPLAGYVLAEHYDLSAQVILARFRVTTDQRPLQASDFRLTYRNGFRDHTQTLHCVFRVEPPVTD
ncbi:hypothetical protein GCM10029976_071860 [Kribbella albertanoniae]|uniref:Uncharacterized protein n=1 Tax=Kribbella albertanoniae TaxID=1266829 RepID=A0A4R4NXY3_9ACTN|nr:hypothetical protein [Kribbella albertanoniae]TDC14379.1 hypothetical protein E1261_43290 [Kribbella albertanoniae]